MPDSSLSHLFAQNRAWAESVTRDDPTFFTTLAALQAPRYLWIGCSDSRVPPNQLTGLRPGELFVHRNVANVVVPSDLNCLATIHFAVDVLKVEHIIVCGHYGCGGVRAALEGQRLGLVNAWIGHVEDVRDRHAAALEACATFDERMKRLCELNVIEQVLHVCRTLVVRDAWSRGQALAVHGWAYSLHDGLLRDLDVTVNAEGTADEACERARAAVLR
ncbi:MAG: carbonate dehydratase [Vicinamibacteraceae bacterium]|nr:carbonate dehydratase [Vicinamibacteraceae bacterium]